MNNVAPFIVAAPNIEELADADINTLVDIHVFGEDAQICPGRVEYHYTSAGGAGTPYWQCDQCGAIVRDATTQHQRVIPDYCKDIAAAWRIVEKIRILDAMVQARFEMAMMPKYRGNIRNVTPRHIAVAALQAVEICDMRGFLEKREVAQ